MDGANGSRPQRVLINGAEQRFETISYFKVHALQSQRPQRFHAHVAQTLFASMPCLRALHLHSVVNISGELLRRLAKSCPRLIEFWLIGCSYENYSSPTWALTELSDLPLRSLCIDNTKLACPPGWWATWQRGQGPHLCPEFDVGLAFCGVSKTIEMLSVRSLFHRKMSAQAVTSIVEKAPLLKLLRCSLPVEVRQMCKSLRPSLVIQEDSYNITSLV